MLAMPLVFHKAASKDMGNILAFYPFIPLQFLGIRAGIATSYSGV